MPDLDEETPPTQNEATTEGPAATTSSSSSAAPVPRRTSSRRTGRNPGSSVSADPSSLLASAEAESSSRSLRRRRPGNRVMFDNNVTTRSIQEGELAAPSSETTQDDGHPTPTKIRRPKRAKITMVQWSVQDSYILTSSTDFVIRVRCKNYRLVY